MCVPRRFLFYVLLSYIFFSLFSYFSSSFRSLFLVFKNKTSAISTVIFQHRTFTLAQDKNAAWCVHKIWILFLSLALSRSHWFFFISVFLQFGLIFFSFVVVRSLFSYLICLAMSNVTALLCCLEMWMRRWKHTKNVAATHWTERTERKRNIIIFGSKFHNICERWRVAG